MFKPWTLLFGQGENSSEHTMSVNHSDLNFTFVLYVLSQWFCFNLSLSLIYRSFWDPHLQRTFSFSRDCEQCEDRSAEFYCVECKLRYCPRCRFIFHSKVDDTTNGALFSLKLCYFRLWFTKSYIWLFTVLNFYSQLEKVITFSLRESYDIIKSNR